MLEIKIPTVYADLPENKYERFVHVEHAPVDARMGKTFLGLALTYAIEGDRIALVGDSAELLPIALLWLEESGIKFKKTTNVPGLSYLKFEMGSLILVDVDKITSTPRIVIDRLLCLDSHRLATDPIELFRDVRYQHYAGHLANRGHWFFDQRNASPFVQLAYPIQVLSIAFDGIVDDKKAHGYTRFYELNDVEVEDVIHVPVLSFLKHRVHIRSDKPMGVLSERQREVAQGQAGTPIIPFDVSSLQKRYLAMKRRTVQMGKMPWFILIKSRRGGFTTLEQAESYRYFSSRPNSDVVTIADTLPKISRIFGMIKRMWEHDPERIKLDGDSASRLEGVNGSNFFTGTAGGSGVARGDGIQRGHWSETAHSCKGKASAAEDVRAGLMAAAQYGELTFETTANGRNFCYQWYKEAKEGTSDFTAIFIRWFDDPMNRAKPGTYSEEEILDTLTDKEKSMIASYGLDVAQIAFRRAGIRRFKKLWPQEYPEDDETCFLTSGSCYFDVHMIADYLETARKPMDVQSVAGGQIIIWEEPQPGKHYVAGSDTSEGLPTSDRNGFFILDADTGREVALAVGRWKPKQLAVIIKRVCSKFNRALVGVERNNHGHAVLQALDDIGYGKPHFHGGPCYYFRAPGKADWTEDMTVQNSKPGWDTNVSTRPMMLAELSEAFSEGHIGSRSTELLGEMSTFVQHESGKWEAEQGCKDDLVIMAAIAWQMRKVPRVVGGFI